MGSKGLRKRPEWHLPRTVVSVIQQAEFPAGQIQSELATVRQIQTRLADSVLMNSLNIAKFGAPMKIPVTRIQHHKRRDQDIVHNAFVLKIVGEMVHRAGPSKMKKVTADAEITVREYLETLPAKVPYHAHPVQPGLAVAPAGSVL